MSYEYEAADEMVKMTLRAMETGVRIAETSAERLVRVVYFLMRDKREETKKARDQMRTLLKQRKTLKAYTMYDEDLKKFSSLAKLYGVNFFILKDEGLNDSITDIVIEETDANKVNHIYKMLKMESPQRKRPDGPTPVFDAEKVRKEVKIVRKSKNEKKEEKGVFPLDDRKSTEKILNEEKDKMYISRRYDLPKTREDGTAVKIPASDRGENGSKEK